MSKLTNMWEVFKAYREENWFPKFEEPKKRERVKDDPNYFKNYYNDHADKIKAYAKEYYQKNKDRLYNNRLTKNQQLVYNYCLQEHWPSWEVLPIQNIANALWLKPFNVYRSLKALVNKWKLFSDWVHIYVGWVPAKETIEVSLFDESEPDLYENVNLEDENFALKRKLKNAEDRYLKLLWEYEDYKKSVKDAYMDLEMAEKVRNDMMGNLDSIIMNR